MSESNFEKIGSLWKRQSKKGTNYLAGEINGEKVMIFHAKDKRSDKSPDFTVVKADDPKPQQQQPKSVEIDDSDIPF
jgi:hypothetical protein